MADILFPIGRMIGGSLEKMNPRLDNAGKPRMNTDGSPMLQCNFGVAIPKTQAAWQNEAWGNIMYNIGRTAEPTLHMTPTFAWKVVDGDSPLPNKNGKIANQQEGYAGNWVLWFSQAWLPKLCDATGTVELQPGAIVPGYYIQVLGDVTSNGAKPPNTPGLYLNPRAVALVGEGDRIVSNDVDTASVGFGGALPPGARPVQPEVPGFAPPAAGQPYVPPAAPAPGLPAGYSMPAPPAAPAQVAPAQVAVQPNAGFMVPPAPPAPAAPVHQMTALANGVPYEAYVAQGWTDDVLRANGLML